jgi:hypothetical protein
MMRWCSSKATDIAAYLMRSYWPADHRIGFTGGEPFMNPEFLQCWSIVWSAARGVVLSKNAMKPMRRYEAELPGLKWKFGSN